MTADRRRMPSGRVGGGHGDTALPDRPFPMTDGCKCGTVCLVSLTAVFNTGLFHWGMQTHTHGHDPLYLSGELSRLVEPLNCLD